MKGIPPMPSEPAKIARHMKARSRNTDDHDRERGRDERNRKHQYGGDRENQDEDRRYPERGPGEHHQDPSEQHPEMAEEAQKSILLALRRDFGLSGVGNRVRQVKLPGYGRGMITRNYSNFTFRKVNLFAPTVLRRRRAQQLMNLLYLRHVDALYQTRMSVLREGPYGRRDYGNRVRYTKHSGSGRDRRTRGARRSG